PHFSRPTAPVGPPPKRLKPPRPQTVRVAFGLMLAGAAVEFLRIMLAFAESTYLRTVEAKHYPALRPEVIDYVVDLIGTIQSCMIFLVVWIGMALLIRAGYHWGRIIGIILFVIKTVLVGGVVLFMLSEWPAGVPQYPFPALNYAAAIASWSLGLATLIA